MRSLSLCLLTSTTLLASVGCSEPVTIYQDLDIDHPMRLEIAFPHEDSFLYSSTADVLVFEITEEERGYICPVLHNLVIRGIGDPRPADLESGHVPICDLRDPDSQLGGEEGVSFSDIQEGVRAFFVATYDVNDTVLVAGCVVGDVVMSDEPISPIVIRLAETSSYSNAISRLPELKCGDIDDKCNGDGC